MDKVTIYTDWKYLFLPLSLEERGKLITAVFKYCDTKGNLIQEETESLQIAFGYIAAEIDRERERQKHVSKVRRIAGKKSARMRKEKRDEQ